MFAIVDIETCGSSFAFQKGRIIDICILIHDGIQVIDKFSTLINPDCYISGFFTNISGITNEMVKGAPRFHEVAKEILAYTEGKLFVAHNSSFDYNFIKAEFASLGFTFRRDTLCTVRLSRKLMPGKKSYSLGNLCTELGIENKARHRAEGDAVATAELLDILLSIKAQSQQYKSTNLDAIMTTRIDNIKKYILKKLPEDCGVYYFQNKNDDIIYIGKSINMYSRAISHFNSDIKKSKAMLNDTYNVDYVVTGSELIALLLEAEEIKTHKPLYNRQRKADVFTHCIDTFVNEKGIHCFAIVPTDESENKLLAFTNYTSAREKLESWIDEHSLCTSYCGLTSEGSICFNHQIKKCLGICSDKETVEQYNARVRSILKEYRYTHPDFIVLDNGRQPNEKSFIYIQNHRYVGYGYLDESTQICSPEDIQSNLTSKKYYPDADDIIRAWIKQKKRQVLVLK